MPETISSERIILENRDASMGLSGILSIDRIVYVDPKAYYEMSYSEKPGIAGIISKVNWAYRGIGKKMLLVVPGRIGTSSPELGVPATFADISEFNVICEVEEKTAGYNPELSYGSHFFQDLVEADILYTAVFADEKTHIWRPEMLEYFRDMSAEFIDENLKSDFGHIIRIFNTEECGCELYHDLQKGRLVLVIRDQLSKDQTI